MSHKPAHLLLVDDDPGLLKLLGLRLTSEGYSVVTAESGAEGLRVLNREKVDLVISDLRMDEMDGMQLFAEIQKVQPGMPVIILTAHGSIPDAVAATQQGVFSFLTKPVDKDALYQAIDDALEQSAPATDERWREAIVTRSPLMLRLLEQARLVAQSDVSVLINGQSGTGKEIFAQLSTTPARAIANHLLLLTVAHCPSNCWSRSCLVMRVARLLALSAIAKVYSSGGRRYAISMRLAICPHRCRSNCCACCRSVKCARWAVTAILISTCGLFPPLTATCQKRWRAGNSVKTSITASTLSA